MKAFYENSLSMLLAIQDFLKEYETLWSGSVPFVNAFNRFKNFVGEVQALMVIVEINRKGFAKAKEQKKMTMIKKFLYLRNAVIPYGNVAGDVELVSFFNSSEWEVENLRDTMLVEKMRGFHSRAQEVLAELAAYNIDGAWLSGFVVFIDDYEEYITKPRLGIAERKTANAMLIGKIKDAKRVLKNEIDYLAENYEEAEPLFTGGYRNARIIVDYGGGRKKKE
jgi:hypothetical protein